MHLFLAITGVLVFFALVVCAAMLYHISEHFQSLLVLLEPPLSREKYLQKLLASTLYGKFVTVPGSPTKPPSLTESALQDLSGFKETVDRFTNNLTPKEREVLKQRFGISVPDTTNLQTSKDVNGG